MYDINMDGYYYKGFLGNNPSLAYELWKDNMTEKTFEFMMEYEEKLFKQRYHEQIIINVLYYHKIGILLPKFGILILIILHYYFLLLTYIDKNINIQ